jgi:hypothetical protein
MGIVPLCPLESEYSDVNVIYLNFMMPLVKGHPFLSPTRVKDLSTGVTLVPNLDLSQP